ncbi:hypothetical protein WDW89_20305, partial [Deltaproteobacteria bacterium TL4]
GLRGELRTGRLKAELQTDRLKAELRTGRLKAELRTGRLKAELRTNHSGKHAKLQKKNRPRKGVLFVALNRHGQSAEALAQALGLRFADPGFAWGFR